MKVIVKWPLSHDGQDYAPAADPQDVAGLNREQAKHLEALGAVEIPKAEAPAKGKAGKAEAPAKATDDGQE